MPENRAQMSKPLHRNSADRLPPNRNYLSFLFFLIVLVSSLVLVISLNREFNHDEFEHVHSAWYVTNNQIPYLDFFEHHHPLLWYLLAPFLSVLGDSTQTVIVLRLLMFAFILGIAFFTFRIAEQATRSRETGLIASVLLLSSTLFVKSAVEIRPDVPMVFFGLVSIRYLFGFFRSGRNRDIILSGLAVAIAFLFLQKIMTLLFCYLAVFIYQIARRRISPKPVLWFALGFAFPVIIFLGGIIISGSIKMYLIDNWALIFFMFSKFSPWIFLEFYFLQNALPWALISVSIAYIIFNRKAGSEIKTVAFLFAFLFLSVIHVKHPYPQYYLMALPLGSIAGAFFLTDVLNRLKTKAVLKTMIVIIIIAGPVSYLWKEPRETNRSQLDLIDYVLQNTSESDYVYDGNADFNLFRRDLHYFWFSVGMDRALDRFRKMARNKYTSRFIDKKYLDYEICRLIRAKEPRFVSSNSMNLKICKLRARYGRTAFPRLYIRIDDKNGERSAIIPASDFSPSRRF